MIDAINIPLPHSTQFADKWGEWVQFRKDIKKSYKTMKGVNGALNMLKAVSEQEAIAMMDKSMTNEYQGLFPEKKEKEETSKIYKELEPPTKSTYEPTNAPSEKERKDFIVGKIESAYKGEIFLNDIGSVYTNRLKHLLSTPESVINQIEIDVHEIATRKPSNRFEEVVEINVDLEVRNRVLRFNMDQWRSQNRKIYEEL